MNFGRSSLSEEEEPPMSLNASELQDRLRSFDDFNDSKMKSMMEASAGEDLTIRPGDLSSRRSNEMDRSRSSEEVNIFESNEEIYIDDDSGSEIFSPPKKESMPETVQNDHDGALEQIFSTRNLVGDIPKSPAAEHRKTRSSSDRGVEKDSRSSERNRSRDRISARERGHRESRSKDRSRSNSSGSGALSISPKLSSRKSHSGSTSRPRSSSRPKPTSKPRRSRSDMYGAQGSTYKVRTNTGSRSPTRSGSLTSSSRRRQSSNSSRSPCRSGSVADSSGKKVMRRRLKSSSSHENLNSLHGKSSLHARSSHGVSGEGRQTTRRRLKGSSDPLGSSTHSSGGGFSRRRRLREDPLQRSYDSPERQSSDPLGASTHSNSGAGGAAARRLAFAQELNQKMKNENDDTDSVKTDSGDEFAEFSSFRASKQFM